jgi:hypothetical protein
MAKFQFAGELAGRTNQVERYGTKSTGLRTKAAGWKGCVEVRVYYDEKTGRDMFLVQMTPWMNSDGVITTLAEGILDARITDPYIVPAMFA